MARRPSQSVLRQRPLLTGRPSDETNVRQHHCWVEGPADDPGPWPGLLIEWRRGPAGWLALVIYIVTDGTTSTTIQGWLPAGSIRPA
jgi:hypothetical protein